MKGVDKLEGFSTRNLYLSRLIRVKLFIWVSSAKIILEFPEKLRKLKKKNQKTTVKIFSKKSFKIDE